MSYSELRGLPLSAIVGLWVKRVSKMPHVFDHTVGRAPAQTQTKPGMHSYAAYGLCLHSDLPLEGFPSGGRTPDIFVYQRELRIADLEQGARGGDRLTGHFYGKLLFEVLDGRSITVHRIAEMDDEDMHALVGGTLLTALMRQRGLLTLHAAAVTDGRQVAGFLGESGWGKSTIAEAFNQQGYEVLTDDQLVLELRDTDILCHPGPASIKLRPESGEVLVPNFADLMQIAKRSTQRRRPVTRRQHDPLPLSRLFVLDPYDSPENVIEQLAGQESVMHLLTHSWARQTFTDSTYVSSHLKQCARLVREVPVQKLKRRRTLSALGDHVSLIEADWLAHSADHICA